MICENCQSCAATHGDIIGRKICGSCSELVVDAALDSSFGFGSFLAAAGRVPRDRQEARTRFLVRLKT